MRLLITLLLLCLLAAGPAAAIAVSPGSASAVVKATPATNPVVATLLPASSQKVTIVVTATVAAPEGGLHLSSTPEGAMISIDDRFLGQTTPADLSLPAGLHTYRLTLDGYQDFTSSLTIVAGTTVKYGAVLRPALNRNMSAVMTIAPGLSANRTIVAATATTPVPGAFCKSGEHCLTTTDAARYYQPMWGYNATAICGYTVTADNQMIPKYCTFGTPSPITSFNCLSGEVCVPLSEVQGKQVLCGWGRTEYEPLPEYCVKDVKADSLQPGAIQSIAAGVPVSYSTLVTAPQTVIPITSPTKEAPGGKQQGGLIDAVFGFFSRLFNPMPQPDYSNLT